MKKIKTALISVSDKRNLKPILNSLKKDNIKILFAGSGSEYNKLSECISNFDLSKNVMLISPWHKSDTYPILSLADCFLLPSIDGQNNLSVPSKLLSYLKVSKPILAVAPKNSTISRIITDNKIGMCVSSMNDPIFKDSFEEFSTMKGDELQFFSSNCKKFYLNQLSENTSLNDITNNIKSFL